jgi:hypothetical protein
LYKNISILSEISLISTKIGSDKENIAAVDVERNSDDTTMTSKKDLNDLCIPSENKTTVKNNEYTIDLQSIVARNDSSEPEASRLDGNIDLSTKAINVKEDTITEEANEKPVVDEENTTTDNQQS